eukprot:scaffold26091_cov101-Isochrysis_galbana.AAC.2
MAWPPAGLAQSRLQPSSNFFFKNVYGFVVPSWPARTAQGCCADVQVPEATARCTAGLSGSTLATCVRIEERRRE